MKEPRTLLEAIRYFSDFENCRLFMMDLRWPDGKVRCPQCGADRVVYLQNARVWKCYEKHPKAKFSLKTGTIFEDSPLGLDKWLAAVWLVVNCKNGISSYEMARDLGVTQKSAWFMNHRIRMALHAGSFDKLTGQIEADETYIGGKARNMHASKRKRLNVQRGRSVAGKTVVMGLLQRHAAGKSKVRTMVLDGLRRGHVQQHVRANVEAGSNLYTDAFSSYAGLAADYEHKVIDHAERYVDGQIHTNGCENFWSLLKRTINGTYVSIEPFHLFRYLDEQAYRFNEREGNDFARFRQATQQIVGRRLTYSELTGKSSLPKSIQ